MRRSRFTSRMVGPTRRACRFAAIAAALAASALAAPAFANTITFETAPFDAHFTGPATEDGFTYSLKSGVLDLNVNGNPGHDMEGASYGGGGVLNIVSAASGDFTFGSLDFMPYYELATSGTQTLDVTGLLGGSTVGTDAYTLANVESFSYTTEAASVLAGKSLSELDIALSAGDASGDLFWEAIDNVVLTPASAAVPEPSALTFLVAGLLGFSLVRRRKT